MAYLKMELTLEEIITLQQNKLRKMRASNRPYSVNILGKEIVIFPGVFYPATDTELMINTLMDQNIVKSDSTVLESCAGSGAISIFMAQKAQKVVCVDINPAAVKNIIENSKIHGLTEKITAFCADLFPASRLKYDLIIINPPYTDKEAHDVVELAFWDKDHQILRRCLHDAKKYIHPSGKIYLSWANFADFDLLESFARSEQYVITKKAEKFTDNKSYRIYELTVSSS